MSVMDIIQKISCLNSHKKIWVICPLCKQEREVRRSVYLKPGQLCQTCSSRIKVNNLSTSKKIYKDQAEKRRVLQRKRLATPVGATTQRLRVLLHSVFRRKGWRDTDAIGCFKNLPYNKAEFYLHIQKCFEEGCCICRLPVSQSEKWHIAHKIPVFEANSIDDVYILFALENLHIAHAKCNRQLSNKRVVNVQY